MQAASEPSGGIGFLAQLRQEVLLHKEKRATFVLSKLATTALLFVLGAVLVYQLVLLFQFDRGQPPGRGVKAFLRAA